MLELELDDDELDDVELLVLVDELVELLVELLVDELVELLVELLDDVLEEVVVKVKAFGSFIARLLIGFRLVRVQRRAFLHPCAQRRRP